jgi:hypothetical protein
LIVALGLDVEADRIRDPMISATRLMLIVSAARSLSCPSASSGPQGAAPLSRRELVTGVPQIKNVKAPSSAPSQAACCASR